MAWSTVAWASGNVVSAAKLQKMSDNLAWLYGHCLMVESVSGREIGLLWKYYTVSEVVPAVTKTINYNTQWGVGAGFFWNDGANNPVVCLQWASGSNQHVTLTVYNESNTQFKVDIWDWGGMPLGGAMWILVCGWKA